MSCIRTPALATATGATAEVYAEIKKDVGKAPNTYAAIGVHGPKALKAILEADSVLAAGSLSHQDQETIKLAVSVAAGCDYCVAAHNMLAKLSGLSAEAVAQIQAGAPTGNARRDALVTFVRNLVRVRAERSPTMRSPPSRRPAIPMPSSWTSVSPLR
jgi:AhpD family alkylhydroperoxidase